MASLAAPRPVLDRLARAAIGFELIHHPRTETALAEARVLGIDPARVAKTVVLVTDAGFVRAVVPASSRIDLDKVRRVLGCDEVQLATERMLAGAYADYELGAVPPFARPDGDRVLVDRRLCASEVVFVEAGTHRQTLRLRTDDLLLLADAAVVDICSGR